MGLKDSVKKYKEMERQRNQEGRGKKGGKVWKKMEVERKVQRSLEAAHSCCTGSWHLNKADSTAQHNTHAVMCALDLSWGKPVLMKGVKDSGDVCRRMYTCTHVEDCLQQ